MPITTIKLYYPCYGPAFGGGCDLKFYNGYWYSYHRSYSYPKLNIPGQFYADDYEVFQVVKKWLDWYNCNFLG